MAAVCGLTFLCSIGTGVVWAGIPFIARHDYGFGKRQTLLLYLSMGLTYVIGALSTGAGLRAVEQRLSHRAVLAIILVISIAASLTLMVSRSGWMLWSVAIAINIVMSWLWPIVESYATAGKHGRAMRNALGLWNITWTSAVLASLLLMAPFVAEHARWSLAGTSAVFGLSLVTLAWFSPHPAAHGSADEDDGVDRREYPHLLRSARMLLLASYVLNSAMSPLLPFLCERVGVAAEHQTPVAAVWTAARVVVVAIMWRAGFWHGRWGTLLLGGLGMASGFVLIVTSSSLPMLIAGLACIGTGMAIVYFATLYYAMTVGAAEVEASGKFEAMIGLGYTAGPAAGLLGERFANRFEQTPLGPDGGVVIAALCLLAIASLLALRPYAKARRARTASGR